MAILIAIAIPVFSTQLDKARKAVDDGTARSAKSLAEADYLLEHAEAGGSWYYGFAQDDDGNLVIKGTPATTKPSGDTASDVEATYNDYKSKGRLYVLVKDGYAYDSWTSENYE